MTIRKWSGDAGSPDVIARLDEIFFESSGTKSFASDEARAAFRERWLGRYLRHYPDWVYAALCQDGKIEGYLLGCLDDPAQTSLFSDIGYFQDFASLTARFPAQLHVNLTPAARGRGAGSMLVAEFARDAARAGAPGVHVVTERAQRNVGFYTRNGFAEQGSVPWNGRDLVFLGRELNCSP